MSEQHAAPGVVVYTAPRRDSTDWQPDTITLAELLDLARAAPELADKADAGALFPGVLDGPGRRQGHRVVTARTLLLLDFDKVEPGWSPDTVPWSSVAYETYSSTPEAPCWRVPVAFDRQPSNDELEQMEPALLKWFPELDPTCLQLVQCMYLPARRPGVEALRTVDQRDHPLLPVDDLVAEGKRIKPAAVGSQGHMLDPFALPGIVGAFNRVYDDLDDLAHEYELPYDPAGPARWQLDGSNSEPGVNELEPGRWYSHHANDPAGGHARTAFDLVRMHRFADLDEDVAPGTKFFDRPSIKAMAKLAGKDQRVTDELPDDDPLPSKTPLAVDLRGHVEDHYELFPGADDGRVFAQPKAGGRAELVSASFVLRATRESGLGSRAGTLSASAVEAAKVLTAFATEHAPREMALRAHYRPGRIVLDFGQPGSSRCAVVTPDGWTVEDVPPRDVVFIDPGRPLPTPEADGDVDALRRLIRWDTDDTRWLLIKGWLPAALLAGMPRPLLGFFGPQGSAKTTTGRYVAGVLDPKPPSVLGGGFGKSRQDDETKALKSYIPAWDNVAGLSAEGADFLSRLVTGDLIEKRQLYSDTDIISVHYRRTGVITGLSVPPGVKADTLDRLILMPIERLADDERVAESTLDAEWEQVHPQVLGGVLTLAVRMLGRMDEAVRHNSAGLRMADYAGALWAVGPELYDAYADNVATARADMAADDPFIQTLVRWLSACGGEWTGTAEEAWLDAEGFQEGRGRPGNKSWWPRSPGAFSAALNRNAELLKSAGVHVGERRSDGKRLRHFATTDPAGVL